MDPRKQAIRGLLDEFLTAIKQPDKTPIVPAPNRWFAKPEEFPHVQPMVEKALTASGKTRDDFLHGAYLDPRTGQDLTGRMMSDVGVLIDPRTGRPMMSGRESGMEEFAELEKRLGNQTMSNLVRRSKFKPTGGDTLLNDIPFIATVEQGPHFYALGTEYASPTQLFQVQTGSNPHLRPKSRGDVFGMGEVVGRMQIGKGPEHDVYEKLFVAPRGSDVPGKKLSKAAGGEVHAAGGGLKQAVRGKIDDFLAELNKPVKAAVKVTEVVAPPRVIKGAQDILPTAEREANLAKFLEKSKVKDRMYHATNADFNSFRRNHRGAQFVTPDRNFANQHIGDDALTGMVDNFEEGANIMPVNVQVEKPFDYEKLQDIKNLFRQSQKDRVPLDRDWKQGILEGNWDSLENEKIMRSIKNLGHDSFYVTERLNDGDVVKNLGIFDPRKIKSAIGNRGTYDINDPDINKAAGGEVHMDKGGDPMLADLIERYNTPRNKSRYSAGIFDSNAPGEVTSITPTVKERMASGLQAAMESAGSDRYKARQRAQTILGGPNSRLPGGFGVADIGAMVNPVVAAGMIPLYGEAALHDLANVPDAIKRGDYVGAGVDTLFGLADVIPAVGQGKQVAKGVAKGLKDAVTSDAGYDLAQNVLRATGTAPLQIMIGPKAKTFRHDAAALAEQMEKEGKNRNEIWQATKTMRAPDNEFRQEISDLAMRYNSNTAKDRQFQAEKRRFLQSANRATNREELDDAEKYFEDRVLNLQNNPIGTAQEFIEHPKLFEAYPELSNYVFRQLEPTNNQFYASENVRGYFSPGEQRITINSNEPNKRSTALHELQHAIQEIEGWQGGASPEQMAARMAERDIAKTRENDLLNSISDMMRIYPSSHDNIIKTEAQKVKNLQDFLNKTKQLEGETNPYDAYRKVSGEEEARMVQERRNYPEEKLARRPPYIDYETDPTKQITNFATGGAVMMADGGMITIEEFLRKQGY
jgi:hypothetical protein